MGDSNDRIVAIPIDKLVPSPFQPRLHISREKLEQLANSMRGGLIEPLLVRHVDGVYRIVSGERRWRAAQLLGWTEIPCRIEEMDDAQEAWAAFVANMQREQLHPIEEAQALEQMRSLGYTTREVVRKTGIPPATVFRRRRLLRLPEEVRKWALHWDVSASVLEKLALLPPGWQEGVMKAAGEPPEPAVVQGLVERGRGIRSGLEGAAAPQQVETPRARNMRGFMAWLLARIDKDPEAILSLLQAGSLVTCWGRPGWPESQGAAWLEYARQENMVCGRCQLRSVNVRWPGYPCSSRPVQSNESCMNYVGPGDPFMVQVPGPQPEAVQVGVDYWVQSPHLIRAKGRPRKVVDKEANVLSEFEAYVLVQARTDADLAHVLSRACSRCVHHASNVAGECDLAGRLRLGAHALVLDNERVIPRCLQFRLAAPTLLPALSPLGPVSYQEWVIGLWRSLIVPALWDGQTPLSPVQLASLAWAAQLEGAIKSGMQAVYDPHAGKLSSIQKVSLQQLCRTTRARRV